MIILYVVLLVIASLLFFVVLAVTWLLCPPIILPFKKDGKIRFDKNDGLKKIDRFYYYLMNEIPYPGGLEYLDGERIVLDGKWDFSFTNPESEQWTEITVPSTYNSAESEYTTHEGYTWYRKIFELKNGQWKEKFARLCFEGMLLRGTVWCNGTLLGSFEGGYSPVFYKLDEVLITGLNTVVVRLDNRLTWTSLPPKQKKGHKPGWHTYGGIIRSVYIDLLPKHYIFKIQTKYKQAEQAASVYIFTHNSATDNEKENESEVLINLVKGTEQKQIKAELVSTENGFSLYKAESLGDRLEPWSIERNELYTIEARLSGKNAEHIAAVKTGFRSVSCKGSHILVNNQAVFFKGISRHEDHPVHGASQPEKLIEQDLDLIKKLNANYIRLAHYPHDVKELNRIAEYGLYCSEEIPLYQAGLGFTAWFLDKEPLSQVPWKTFGLRQLLRKKLLRNARDQLIRMIERDRNNPAILFWSMGNECYSIGKTPGKVFGWLAGIAKMLDSERLTTYVDLTFDIPVMDYWKRAWTGVDIYSQNSYFGWYYSTLNGLKPYLKKTLECTANKPVLLSEFGAGALLGRKDTDGEWRAERVPPGRTYSEDYQAKVYEAYWQEAVENPRVQGISPWVFADFYNSWFPGNPIPNYNLKGIVSKERKQKKSYYLLQKLFSK